MSIRLIGSVDRSDRPACRQQWMKAAMSLACAPNFRDLGGLPAEGEAHIRHGLLFRAEAIVEPAAADRERLDALGVRLVCDLRGKREVAAAASHWSSSGATVLAMDIVADFRAGEDLLAALRAEPGEAAALRMMLDTYEALPAACAPHLALLFERLAGGDVPLLIHCTAGKDRTGFVVAMLLHALGVEEAAIMGDYLRSADHLGPAVVEATRAVMDAGLGRPVRQAELAAVCGVRPAFLRASHDRIMRDHGSVHAYLRDAARLDSDMRRALRDALLARRGDKGDKG